MCIEAHPKSMFTVANKTIHSLSAEHPCARRDNEAEAYRRLPLRILSNYFLDRSTVPKTLTTSKDIHPPPAIEEKFLDTSLRPQTSGVLDPVHLDPADSK